MTTVTIIKRCSCSCVDGGIKLSVSKLRLIIIAKQVTEVFHFYHKTMQEDDWKE